MVDFRRIEPGKQIVERIEYDPNRSAHLALLEHVKTKKRSYIIAAEGMRAGDAVESYMSGIPQDLIKSMGGTVDPGMLAAKTAFRGNCLPMHMVPLGTQVYCIGSQPKKGAVFCRSAGTYGTVVTKDETNSKVRDVTVRLQSGEVRKVSKDACATVGVASNPHWHFRQLGKAGRSRWLNIRPTVRGVAMNAADHPHGGGRGKSKGNVHPVSIWGTPVSTKVAVLGWCHVANLNDRLKVGTRQERRETRISMWSSKDRGTRARGDRSRIAYLYSFSASPGFYCIAKQVALIVYNMHIDNIYSHNICKGMESPLTYPRPIYIIEPHLIPQSPLQARQSQTFAARHHF